MRYSLAQLVVLAASACGPRSPAPARALVEPSTIAAPVTDATPRNEDARPVADDSGDASRPADPPTRRACAENQVTGVMARIVGHQTALVDDAGRLVEVEIREKEGGPVIAHRRFAYEGGELVAGSFDVTDKVNWTRAELDPSGSFVARELSGHSEVYVREAEGSVGKEPPPPTVVPLHDGLDSFPMPWSMDFTGLVRERSLTGAKTVYHYERGRLVRKQRRGGGMDERTVSYTWDDAGRLTAIRITPRSDDLPIPDRWVLHWQGDQLDEVVMFRGRQERSRSRLRHDDRGRPIELTSSVKGKGEVNKMSYSYACDDFVPTHGFAGLMLP